jgi:hypothetical protein
VRSRNAEGGKKEGKKVRRLEDRKGWKWEALELGSRNDLKWEIGKKEVGKLRK